jgi:hypothetical protein
MFLFASGSFNSCEAIQLGCGKCFKKNVYNIGTGGTGIQVSVAEPELEPEPEPVEQQLFSGAGAKVFLPGFGSGVVYVNSYKILQNPQIFHTKV